MSTDMYAHIMEQIEEFGINLEAIPSDSLQILSNDLDKLIIKKRKVLDLDTQLRSWMYETQNTNTIIADTDFQEKLNDSDSLIIYVKNAQLYKIYKNDNMTDFEQDVGTHYRKPDDNGVAYEVIRDSLPQKLMIVMKVNMDSDQLKIIKKYIMDFIKSEPTLSETKPSDLKIYGNDNNTEFIVSSVLLDNMSAKELFIEKFIRFMQQKGENELANQIQLRLPPCYELEGARLNKIPYIKTMLENNSNTCLISDLLTNSKTINGNIIINNTYNIVGNTINSNNTTNSNISVSQGQNSNKSIKSFCKYIYDTKPSWYIESKYVSLCDIENAYRNYFDDNDIALSMISKKLKGSIFTNSTRINNITKKKLVSYSVLQKSC